MKTVKKRQQSVVLSFLLILIALLGTTSCGNDVDIKRDFDYRIHMQKYRSDAKLEECREYVFIIENEGGFDGVTYSVCYFLRKGDGLLTDTNSVKLQNNIPYTIHGDTLKVLYTPAVKGNHIIETEFIDNFKNKKEINIELEVQ